LLFSVVLARTGVMAYNAPRMITFLLSLLLSLLPQTTIPGSSGITARDSVMRIDCGGQPAGTGFLHKSGLLITAAHVVESCTLDELNIKTIAGQRLDPVEINADRRLDLALIHFTERSNPHTFPIKAARTLQVGSQVDIWGFPAGYNGQQALLTVGYIAGSDGFSWIINGAINLGNSGGPIVDLRDGSVVGLAVAKLTPFPVGIESRLKALTDTHGAGYTETQPDGTTIQRSEAQVVADVLEYLRSQTQLVIGYAVPSEVLREFLISNSVEP
jgi:S1-C subfamily serine protease